ncbi:type VII secretion protein EccB [Nocardioides coralli]|uniref:type VII secretion protein EccB n=1 Tax=Nocardioides coralli TaxID=2872154 RepID=UPI001CA45E89|nr:type VII secretion protein EccB [Nocardioides coralli]QZY29334.1 type VII secretion protein EccB [Nocardioides coralli]
MATKKDLVEAYAFSRRRLVTAFVSGAPGGREVEPARPGRSVVGGLALGVLLMAGAAIAGIFTTNVDPAWAEQPGLVVSKEEAAVYVITRSSSDPVLHPVLNITSAKLILGSDQEPQVIPDSYIDDETIGSDVGIFGAPSDVPDVGRLIPSGWTGCADGRQLRLSVSGQDTATTSPPDAGMLVRVENRRYVVALGRPDDDGLARAHSYEVPRDRRAENLLRALGLEDFDAKRVSQEWLDLLPTGGRLDRDAFGLDVSAPPLDIAEAGRPVPVGAIVTAPDGTAFLATQDGLEVLDEFARRVYEQGRAERTQVVELDSAPPPTAGRPTYREAAWPTTTLAQVFGEACLRLVTDAGSTPRVEVVEDPADGAAASGSDGLSVSVDDGHGAYVLAGGWDDTDSGQPFVVDAKGFAYPLGSVSDAELLGYADYPVRVVPDPWIELFRPGVELSANAALCEPQVEATGC